MRLRAWMVAAAIAGLITAAAPFVPDAWGESSIASILVAPLGFGLILESAPFGGPHNAPLAAPFVVLATAINAAFFGFVFWLLSRCVGAQTDAAAARRTLKLTKEFIRSRMS